MISYAIMVLAREIAVADALGQYQETVRRAKAALQYYGEHAHILTENNIQLMLIPHGQTIYEWGRCMWDLIHLHRMHLGSERRFTIGVPKMYERWAGGRMNLMDRFVVEAWKLHPCDVHLLGIEGPLHSLTSIAQRYPWVRSTDSAKPFTYAMGGIAFDGRYGGREMEQNPGRPENYFDRTMTAEELVIARHNVDIFRERAMTAGVRG